MKQPRSRQEPRRMGNPPWSSPCCSPLRPHLHQGPLPLHPVPQQAGAAAGPGGGIDEDYDSSRYKISGPIGEEEFDPSRPTCYNTSKRPSGARRSATSGSTATTQNLHQPAGQGGGLPYARRHDAVAMDDVREFALLPSAAATTAPCRRSAPGTTCPGLPLLQRRVRGQPVPRLHGRARPALHQHPPLRRRGAVPAHRHQGLRLDKFTPLFRQLSNYDVIDVDNDQEVHRFPRIVIGSTFHCPMGIDGTCSPGGETVADFKRLLRCAFRLDRGGIPRRVGQPRQAAAPHHLPQVVPPVLNERAMAARRRAGAVRRAHRGSRTTTRTCQTSRGWWCRSEGWRAVPVTFKDPAKDFDVTYMEYNVSLEESSPKNLHPKDHFYLQHPYDVHKKGWNAIKTVYLDKQSVRLDLAKLTRTLEHARSLLPSSSSH
ncbi:hypothetical protein ZWY2020_001866 [Hordeum vulgare]|nr:hypothetical protein ZWY2020_001866 [Hordeum vulgare]